MPKFLSSQQAQNPVHGQDVCSQQSASHQSHITVRCAIAMLQSARPLAHSQEHNPRHIRTPDTSDNQVRYNTTPQQMQQPTPEVQQRSKEDSCNHQTGDMGPVGPRSRDTDPCRRQREGDDKCRDELVLDVPWGLFTLHWSAGLPVRAAMRSKKGSHSMVVTRSGRW